MRAANRHIAPNHALGALFIALSCALAPTPSAYATDFGASNSTISEQNRGRGSQNDGRANDGRTIDCARSPADPRCNSQPNSYPHAPRYPQQSAPYYRQRPVIINQLPEQPAIDINALSDDWPGCRQAKLGALRAARSGTTSEANKLDDWLWKNCRAYSNELRQLEQDEM